MGSVAQNDHTALTDGGGAAGTAVHRAIDEHQGVARRGVDRDGSGQGVHAVAPRVVAGLRVGKVRLVATGHEHRGAVTGSDANECGRHEPDDCCSPG